MKKDVIAIMPLLQSGGAENVLVALMNKMCEKGYNVTLALIKENAVIEFELDNRICIIRKQRFYKNKALNILSEIFFIRRLIKKNRQSTIISFIAMFNYYTLLASIGLKAKIIISERSNPIRSAEAAFHYKLGEFANKIRKFMYAKSSYLVVQTEDALNYFKDHKKTNSVLIPNPLRENLPVKVSYDDPYVFVAIARLEEVKNFPMMMKAMNKVYQKYPHAKLRIYGKGSLEYNLKEFKKTLDYPDCIEFMGHTDNVYDPLMNAYAFVLTSDYEGLSNSMLEALAVGTPCICTDCPIGGARMMIDDHKSGLIVPVGDVESLYKAMLELIENPEERIAYGTKSKQIREKLNIDVIFEKWDKLL